jgi:Kef-type K+ transport system membrane component KefB/voltage-gated potassium channel Kch
MDHAFTELALLILLSTGAGILGLIARQPLVVPFIAVGVLAGPGALGILSTTALIETLSEISIAVLLFLVGMKLDISLVRSLGRVAVIAGVGQVLLTSLFGTAIALALGLAPPTALFLGVAISFSSTIIVVKLLSDKLEIDALHGKIALGILIVQDLAVVVGMVALSALGLGGDADGDGGLLRLALGGAALVIGTILVARYAAEPVLRFVTRSPELMVVFAVGWAVALAAAADAAGLGKEIGGLLAGVALASTTFREALGSRLAGLRDFLLLFFFVHLGATLDLSSLGAQVLPALVLSGFVLVGKPLIVLTITGFLGYRSRTGFLAGITLAQISEFSLIFTAFGIAQGLVAPETMGLVTLTGLITIAVSAYLIAFSHRLYAALAPWLAMFERNPHRDDGDDGADGGFDYIVFGLGRYGCRIGEELTASGQRVLGIDFDPAALDAWRALGHPGHFGDVTDPAFAAHLPLNGVSGVISAVPRARGPLTESDPQLALLHGLRAAGFDRTVAVTVHHAHEATSYLDQGADIVLTPFHDAANRAAARLIAARQD